MKRKILWLAAALIALALASCGDSDAVRLAKSSTFSDSDTKLETLVENFFDSPKWASGKADDGQTYVNISGKCFFDEKKIDVVLQYSADLEAETIEFNALEFNGIPQAPMMYVGLLGAMYEANGEKFDIEF